MQWFKHATDASEDPVIAQAWDKFGDAGYSTYFILLEFYGQQFNPAKPDAGLTVSKRQLARKLRKRWVRVELLLNFYATSGKFFIFQDEETVTIKIPKFTEILSNWTKRKIRPTEVPTEVPTARDKSKNKNKNIYAQNGFEVFWKSYPKKRGKGDAFKKWKQLKKTKLLPDEEVILNAIAEQQKSKDWNRDGGQFIPYPATWLNQHRWEDEVEVKQDVPPPTMRAPR